MVRLICLPSAASILTSRSTLHLSIRPLITSFKRAGVVHMSCHLTLAEAAIAPDLRYF